MNGASQMSRSSAQISAGQTPSHSQMDHLASAHSQCIHAVPDSRTSIPTAFQIECILMCLGRLHTHSTLSALTPVHRVCVYPIVRHHQVFACRKFASGNDASDSKALTRSNDASDRIAHTASGNDASGIRCNDASGIRIRCKRTYHTRPFFEDKAPGLRGYLSTFVTWGLTTLSISTQLPIPSSLTSLCNLPLNPNASDKRIWRNSTHRTPDVALHAMRANLVYHP